MTHSTQESKAPKMTQADEARDYLVWSAEHQLWWRPNRSSYTPDILYAGLYTKSEAKEITGLRRLSSDRRKPAEIAVHVSEKRDELVAERDRIQRLIDIGDGVSGDQVSVPTADIEDLKNHADMWTHYLSDVVKKYTARWLASSREVSR